MSFGKGFGVTLFAVLVAYAAGDLVPINFDKCPEEPPPLQVRVINCVAQPCEFCRGDSIHAEVDVQPDSKVTEIQHDINIQVGQAWLKLQPGVIKGFILLKEGEYPIEAGTIATCAMEVPIKDTYPKIRIVVEHIMKDQSGKVLCCYRVQGKVGDSCHKKEESGKQ